MPCSVVVAILANWVRVFSIVLAGHLTNMKHPLITKGHYWFGWGVFAVAMVLFFVVESRFSSPAKAKSDGEGPCRWTVRSTQTIGDGASRSWC